MPKAPSERELSSVCETEGERVAIKFLQILVVQAPSVTLARATSLSEGGFFVFGRGFSFYDKKDRERKILCPFVFYLANS